MDMLHEYWAKAHEYVAVTTDGHKEFEFLVAFFFITRVTPLYHLYVQVNSLTWLAPQESFAPQVLKILITSHTCMRSWEREGCTGFALSFHHSVIL